MRIGIVQKLRKGFEEVGRRGPFIPATMEGDPTNKEILPILHWLTSILLSNTENRVKQAFLLKVLELCIGSKWICSWKI